MLHKYCGHLWPTRRGSCPGPRVAATTVTVKPPPAASCNDWMATMGSTQYYISKKNASRPVIQAAALNYQWQEHLEAENLLDDSIYIFPNPSSNSSLGSPSQESDASNLTDYTFSGISEPRSPLDYGKGAHTPTGSPLTPLTPSEGIGQPEWPWSEARETHIRGITTVYGGVDNRRELLLQRPRSARATLSSSSFHSLSTGINLPRHPLTTLPFLSFIASLLSVDETTLQLLSSSATVDDTRTELHGVEKLSLRAKEYRVVKEGFAVVADSPGSLSMWDLFTDLMGNKGVREKVSRSS